MHISTQCTDFNNITCDELEKENEKGIGFIIESGRITGTEKEIIPATDDQSEQG